MKKLYLLIPAFLFSFFVSGQSVISNVIPDFGDQFVLNQAEFAPHPGPAGANVTWDFSDHEINEFTANYTVMLPTEVEGAEMFPDASMIWVVELDGFLLASFMGFTNNIFREYGTRSTYDGMSFGVQYSDPFNHFAFPFSFQDTGGDTYAGEVYGIGTNNAITGTQSYVVDGWGTVITPFGTFDNVLRITETSVETMVTSPTINMITNTIQTSWYSPDYPVPVMVINTDHSSIMGMPTDSSQAVAALVSYTPATVGLNYRKSQNTLSIYPNPTTDQITISAEGLTENAVLNIYSATGKLTKQVSLTANEKVDVSDLSPGIYIAVLQVNGKRYAQRPFSVIR